MSDCTEKISQINWLTIKNNHFRGFIELRPLQTCKTYSVEMIPLKSLKNQVINSGKNFTTIQTTLCKAGPKERDSHNIGAKNPNGLELTVVLLSLIHI